LTARNARRARRVAKRVVIDTNLDLPIDSVLVATAKEAPVIVFCSDRAAQQKQDHAKMLESAGVVLAPMPEVNGKLDLRACLKSLLQDHDVATVLVEAGAGLLSGLMNDRLIDELRVYVAPMLMGDESAMPVMRGGEAGMISQLDRFRLDRIRRFGDDALLRYRVNPLIS
jgi:diaminohydroxyphosphoribosylaminopyrimidine deaminase / 5-amino-6-(5-phosphoribosylamino)uracil reductase